MSPYSPLKVFHHRDRLERLKRRQIVYPAQVQVILSDLCNHDCGFCSYRWSGYSSNELFTIDAPLAKFGHNNPNRMLPYEKVVEILDDCKEMGTKALQYSVWGEESIPLVTPDNKLVTHAIGDFVDQFFESPCHKHESLDVSDRGWCAFAITDSGTVVLDRLTHVYRHPSIEPMYEVTLHNGISAFCTASHSLNVVRDGSIAKVPVCEITTDDFIACGDWGSDGQFFDAVVEMPKSNAAHAATDVFDLVNVDDNFCRLLGYYVSEGSSASRSLSFIFSKTDRDREYIDDIVSMCPVVFGCEAKTDDSHDSKVVVRIDSVRVQSLFRELAGRRQAERFVPGVIWDAPVELKIEFLKGLFGGDGNYRSNSDSRGGKRNSLHLKTCNRRLALEVFSLLRQLGVSPTLTHGVNGMRSIDGRVLPKTDYWSVNVSNRASLEKLSPVLSCMNASCQYSDDSPYSSHKPRYSPFGLDCQAVPVKSVRLAEEKGMPVVYDITVSSTHRFLLSSGIGAANTGGGEPTVHPQHRQIFKDTLDRGLEFSLVSNGAIFRDADELPSTIDLLLQATWCRFSMDAGKRDTYAEVRRVSKNVFDTFRKNVSALVRARDRLGMRDPTIGIGFVVTQENWREVRLATVIARDMGVDNLRISAVFQPDDDAYFAEFYEEAAELCRECTHFSDDRFTVFNNFGERVSDLHQKAPDYEMCGIQHFNTYIGGDLNLYRCCVTSYSNHGKLASLKEQGFKAAWESEAVQRALYDFDARSCQRCMFNGKNRTILYAIDPKPAHVNFV